MGAENPNRETERIRFLTEQEGFRSEPDRHSRELMGRRSYRLVAAEVTQVEAINLSVNMFLASIRSEEGEEVAENVLKKSH